MGLLLREPRQDEAEADRRWLLAESDRLLERVEVLRLMNRTTAPPALGASIRALQAKVGLLERGPRPGPATLRAAHNAIFAVQHRLLAANPRHPRPRSHAGRGAGVPDVRLLPRLATWKFLALPPPWAAGDLGWGELVRLTVVRALDRWSYAQGLAVRAARNRLPEAPRRVTEARAAWTNYWDLHNEAQRLAGRPEEPGDHPP